MFDKEKLEATCLGIKSTAHTFGASVVSKGKVLSNEKKAFVTTSGGMVPFDVAQHHLRICGDVINAALQKANVKLSNVDVIAYSRSPGMGHTLRIGATCARDLATRAKKPVVGVNHCIAHLEIGHLLTDAVDPILCYLSGANTQIIAYEGKRYRVFGETLDIGIGNLLDTIARKMGLGFPGGPKIAELAQKGSQDDFISLPYTVKGMDIGFGGLETHISKLIEQGIDPVIIAYSLQETIFAMVVEVTERALAHCNKSEVLLGGGVACNTRLQEMMHDMCVQRSARSFVLPNEFNVDNAAMIAWQGLQLFASGNTLMPAAADFDSLERTDEVAVMWKGGSEIYAK